MTIQPTVCVPLIIVFVSGYLLKSPQYSKGYNNIAHLMILNSKPPTVLAVSVCRRSVLTQGLCCLTLKRAESCSLIAQSGNEFNKTRSSCKVEQVFLIANRSSGTVESNSHMRSNFLKAHVLLTKWHIWINGPILQLQHENYSHGE